MILFSFPVKATVTFTVTLLWSCWLNPQLCNATTTSTTTTTTTINNVACDVGPDALTNFLFHITNETIPQYCIPNPAGGRDRCYYLFVPSCAVGPTALVMDLHGSHSCPLFSTLYDRWAETAIRHCFAIVWPVGVTDPEVADDSCFHIPGGRPLLTGLFITQSCCCAKQGQGLNDTATLDLVVLKTMMQDILWNKRMDQQSKNGTATMDATRVYMAGHSNGCMAALSMGAVHSDIVTAVCCHAGGLVTQPPVMYTPIPTWIVSGQRDTAVWPQFVEETWYYYGSYRHNCSILDRETPLLQGVGIQYSDENCTDNATVVWVSLNESGHIPFYNTFEVSPGASKTTIDTTAMAWEFCSSYAKDEIPHDLIQQQETTPISTSSGDGTVYSKSSSWRGDTLTVAILTLLLVLF